MPMYNLIEYNDDYSKTSQSREQYCREKENDPTRGSKSFKFKVRTTEENPNDCILINKEITAPCKNLSKY